MFLRFPKDIVVAIAEAICPHCAHDMVLPRLFAEDPDQQEDSAISYRARVAALSRLSRTCRKMRAIVQPILFHCPFAEGSRFVSLAHTIARRPDLAYDVRHLSITAHDLAAHTPSVDVSLLNGVLDELFTKGNSDESFRLLPAPSPSDNDYDPFGDSWDLDIILTVLIICRAVNLERLLLSSKHYEWPEMLPSTALCRLRELSVNCEIGRHSGMGESKSGDLAAIAPIVNASPMLQILRGTDMILYSQPGLAHACVAEVDLRMTDLRPEDLVDLFKGFPNIKKFTYHAGCSMGGYSQNLHPKAMERALWHCRESLTHLCLSLEHNVDRSQWRWQDMMTDLRQMKALEVLELDGCSIYACDAPCLPDAVSQASLASLLPPSIRDFSLHLHRQHGHVLEDITRLLQAMPHQLGRLRTVWVQGLDEDTQSSVETMLQLHHRNTNIIN